MNNPNLFQKIIARVGKEHNIQHIILTNYNCRKINEIVAETEKHICNVISIKSILYYNPLLFVKLCCNDEVYSSLNNIMFQIAKIELKKLLVKEKALQKFNKSLKRENRYNLKKNPNFESYINYAQNNGIDVLNLVLVSFQWPYSFEGYEYWKDIHKKYRALIYKRLFNYNFNENRI